MMDGLILVHKPLFLTSHDVVDRIRKIVGMRRVGHFGTLDPLATGLLLIGTGRATRLFPFFSGLDKTYQGSVTFGTATDTYDAEGQPIGSECRDYPSRERIEQALTAFRGNISQIPPPYSAKKIAGKPSYRLARDKQKVELQPIQVRIDAFDLMDYRPPVLDVEITCSSGTYIRSLAHDLGREVDCGAHLTRLVRTRIGSYLVKNSFTLEQMARFSPASHPAPFLVPMEDLFLDWPKILLNTSGVDLARNGNLVFPENFQTFSAGESGDLPAPSGENTVLRLFTPQGRLLAFARKHSEKSGLHPFLVVGDENT